MFSTLLILALAGCGDASIWDHLDRDGDEPHSEESAASSESDEGSNQVKCNDGKLPEESGWHAIDNCGLAGQAEMKSLWTGKDLIVYDADEPYGVDGSRLYIYNPSTNTWRLSAAAPDDAQISAPSVWIGTEAVFWSGQVNLIYEPETDVWRTISAVGAPDHRSAHSLIWTGTEVIVFGGYGAEMLGGIYNPKTDTWRELATRDAPAPRTLHSAVWTGETMIVVGGIDENCEVLASGGIFDPKANEWTPIAPETIPDGLAQHHAYWTGEKMLLWGMRPCAGWGTDGLSFDPKTMTWTAMSKKDQPSNRAAFASAWTGTKMLIAFGYQTRDRSKPTTGSFYDPKADVWETFEIPKDVGARTALAYAWIGDAFLFWGGTPGQASGEFYASGYVFRP